MEVVMLECYLPAAGDNRRRGDSMCSTGSSASGEDGEHAGSLQSRTKRFRRDVNIPARINSAPVLWEANLESDGKAMLVTDDRCYVGTTDGRVVEFDHKGTVLRHMRLEGHVSSVIRDGECVYAWCHARSGLESWKGALYDITDNTPWLMYDIVNMGDWLVHATVVDSCLAVADNRGLVALLTLGEVVKWSQEADGAGQFFEGDSSGIYAAHRRTVCRYGLHSGQVIWTYNIEEGNRHVTVRTGVMDTEHIFVDISGRIVQIAKDNGGAVREFCPSNHRAGGLCVGSLFLITGSSPTAIFDLQTGSELYRMNFPGRLDNGISRMVQSGKMFTFWDRLYCVDLTTRSVLKAVEGASFRSKTVLVRPDTAEDCADGSEGSAQQLILETEPKSDMGDKDGEKETGSATAADGGETQAGCATGEVTQAEERQTFILEPRDHSGVISYHCTSPDCYESWKVAMPPQLMLTGTRFVANKLVASRLGNFYRVVGSVRMLPAQSRSSSESDQ